MPPLQVPYQHVAIDITATSIYTIIIIIIVVVVVVIIIVVVIFIVIIGTIALTNEPAATFAPHSYRPMNCATTQTSFFSPFLGTIRDEPAAQHH
jgi:heme/copper-type cytochrome/quinol oxidase subunit 2